MENRHMLKPHIVLCKVIIIQMTVIKCWNTYFPQEQIPTTLHFSDITSKFRTLNISAIVVLKNSIYFVILSEILIYLNTKLHTI
jgi:hypothetical protein